MAGEAFAGMSALKAALDIARGLKEIDDATRRNAAIIELQDKILSAQSALFALIDEVAALKKEVIRLKTRSEDNGDRA